MKISDLHNVVHQAEATGRDLEVAIVVDHGGDNLIVHRIDSVYMDSKLGVLTVVASPPVSS